MPGHSPVPSLYYPEYLFPTPAAGLSEARVSGNVQATGVKIRKRRRQRPD